MANPLYGQNKFDDNLGDGKYFENKLAYYSWNWQHLNLRAAADVTDAKARSGITLVDGDICECLVDGGTGASAITLPSASYGALTVFRHSVAADGGENMVISCASGDTFKAGTMNVQVEAQEVLHLMTPVYTMEWTATVAIGAGSIETIAAANNTLTYAQTATNNQTNIGAEWAFFCEKDNKWSVAFRGAETGSGAVNASLAFSTA